MELCRTAVGWAAVVALMTPATAGAAWSRASVVPGTAAAGFPFDVAVGRDGVTAVAYIRGGLRVAVRDASGRWRRARRVSVGRAPITAPDVEVSAGGEVIVAWTQSARRAAPVRGPNHIELALRTRGGRWGSPRAVGVSQHFIAADPRLAVNDRGDAVVMWRGQAGRRDVLRAALRRAGGKFHRGASLGEGGIDQRVLMDPAGRARAMWTRTIPPQHLHSEIRYATTTGRGGWTAARTVHSGSDGGAAFGLAPDGSVVAAWRSGEEGIGATRVGQVTVAVSDAGGAFGPARSPSDVRADEVHVGVSTAGEAVVAWSPALDDISGASDRVLYWATRPLGGDFSAVNVTPGTRAGAFGLLDDGTALTVDDGHGIESSVRPPAGAFGPPEQIASAGDFPLLATAGRTAVTVWLSRGRLATSTLRP
jgi:hypothetical protein